MECEATKPGEPLRQGDIFAAHPGTPLWEDPWTRFGVIISADCDIAQGKAGPKLVYIPIIGHYTYLVDVWVPEEAERLRQLAREMIGKKTQSIRPGFRVPAYRGLEFGAEDLTEYGNN